MMGQNFYLDYKTRFDTENAYYLIKSGDAAAYSASGLCFNTDIKAEGAEGSGFWQDQTKKTKLDLPNVPKDLSEYSVLAMNIYSEKASGATFTLCITCPKNDDGRYPYKKFEGVIDWEGWKQFIIPIGEMFGAYNPDISCVTGIRWNADGWKNVPSADSKLYFDSVSLMATVYEYTAPIETIGEDIYDKILKTVVGFTVGEQDIFEADDNSRAQLERYISEAESALLTMRESGDPWDYDMEDTEGMTEQYGRILLLAKAYAVRGGKYYRDGELLGRIKSVLHYMHDNYYSKKSVKTFAKHNNWWDWEIGSAQHIVNILMLCGEGFTREETDHFLRPVNKYVQYPSMTMANLVDMAYVCVAASALQRDAQRLLISRNKLYECMECVTKGDGFYRDGSFLQHDIIPYTGSYGPIMIEVLSKIILAVNDTCFRVKKQLIDCQYGWLLNSYVPLMYHGAFYGMVRGRSICRASTDVSLGRSAVEGMLRMTRYVDVDQKKAIAEILKEYSSSNHAHYLAEMDPYDQQIYKEIMADSGIKARSRYEFVKMFASMDRAVATLTDYGVGISLSSSRIAKYEAMNRENGKGWYTGDGMLYIYTSVDDYDPEYWHNVNMYRIPGTTVTTAPRVDEDTKSRDTLSKYDFVGGCSLGRTLAVAMQLESATEAMGAPTFGTAFSSTLTGKKAWFVFDKEIVCLGAGLSSSDEYNSETVIENRRLSYKESFYANGSAAEGAKGEIKDCPSIWFSTLGGIYLPGGENVNYNRTSGDVPFLELYIDHGKSFADGGYAYVVLPTMTKEETDAYCASPEVEILSNTSEIQAVRDNSSNTTGYIFHKAGSFDGVTVSDACAVLIQGNTVAFSDPTMKLEALTVTVDGDEFTVQPSEGQTYTFNKG